MMARSKTRLAKEESLIEHELDALPVDEESSAEEIHALIEREKEDFITFEEYAKRRGISL